MKFQHVSLALCLFAAPSTAQIQFDLITIDQLEIDSSVMPGLGMSWGMLVNTGTQPIAVTADWGAGLWYGESTAPVDYFSFSLVNPLIGEHLLLPGHAMGNAHPLLTAELQPGEIFDSGGMIAHVQLGSPNPVVDYDLELLAQVGGQVAHTKTHVVYKDLGGGLYNWVSAKRVSSVPSVDPVLRYGTNCSPTRLPAIDVQGSGVSAGPPYAAVASNMPHLGNGSFALRIFAGVKSSAFLVGIDTVSGSFAIAGCEVLLGLTPSMLVIPGWFPHWGSLVPVPIPDDPALTGVQLFVQAVLAAPTFTTTDALAVTLVDILP